MFLGDFLALRTQSAPGALIVGDLGARYASPKVQYQGSGALETAPCAAGPNPILNVVPVYHYTDIPKVRFEAYSTVQAVAFSVPYPGVFLGYSNFDGVLAKIRLACSDTSASGESYSFSALYVNGISVLPAGVSFQLSPMIPAGFIDFDLMDYNIPVPDGALLQVVPSYIPGPSPTPLTNVQMAVFVAKR